MNIKDLNTEALLAQIGDVAERHRKSMEAEIQTVLASVAQAADVLDTLPHREDLLQRSEIVATTDFDIRETPHYRNGFIEVDLEGFRVRLAENRSSADKRLPVGSYRVVLFVLRKDT